MANIATSIYTDGGNGDALRAPTPRTMYFGSGDLTLETWVNFAAIAGTDRVIWWQDSGTNRGGLIHNSGTGFRVYVEVSGSGVIDVNQGTQLHTTGQWTHIAAVRTGKQCWTLYQDGKQVKCVIDSTVWPNYTGFVNIGNDGTASGTEGVNGYFDETRISSVARYGNIDTPTTQLNTWQTAGRGQNALLPHHTKLLIQANTTTTTSSTIIDETGRHTVTVTGAAHSQGKTNFGNTAIYFDGSNDVLTLADSSDWDMTQDFSLETWVAHVDHAGTDDYFHQGRTSSPNNDYFHFFHHNTAGLRFTNEASSGGYIVDTGAHGEIADNDWHHVAVCKIGNVY